MCVHVCIRAWRTLPVCAGGRERGRPAPLGSNSPVFRADRYRWKEDSFLQLLYHRDGERVLEVHLKHRRRLVEKSAQRDEPYGQAYKSVNCNFHAAAEEPPTWACLNLRKPAVCPPSVVKCLLKQCRFSQDSSLSAVFYAEARAPPRNNLLTRILCRF